MWECRTSYRDWRAEARAKREAQLTFFRQLANGNKKKLTRSEERCIMNASQTAK